MRNGEAPVAQTFDAHRRLPADEVPRHKRGEHLLHRVHCSRRNSQPVAAINTGMSSNTSQHVYRVDKFRVPAAARSEFLERVRATHTSLRNLPGFIEDFVLEQTGGPGGFNYVTVVIWRDAEALNQARTAMEEERRATGFDPKDLFSRLNIEADLANYVEVAF